VELRLFGLSEWIEHRRDLRRAWQADARDLLERDKRQAYYHAQRLAARARARKDRAAAWHWAAVASEVARLSPVAEMHWQVVKAIAAEERAHVSGPPSPGPRYK
jgi:hypothetical protein